MNENVNAITKMIIGAAIEVHKKLGPGLLEKTYEECLVIELQERKIEFERQKSLAIEYKGKNIENAFRIDLLIEDSIIIELKSVEKIEDIHKAQLLTYLKLTNKKLGLIINFNVKTLKDGVVRLVN